ncbi:MAG: TonB-dependent receptor plug domain-containing protein, partial [Pseudomonadota bacterium]
MSKYQSIRTAFILTTAAALASPALASDVITVTATKRPEGVLSVPASVTVLSNDTADSLNALNSAEGITQYVTGLQAAVANGTQIAFQIRGIGAVDHQALTPGAAAVYADGVFLATNVQTGPLLYDIERVEVLKGPQGSLYGRNASSGAVNFISIRPSQEQEQYASVSLGNFDRRDITAALGTSLTDTVSVRLAGRLLKQDAVLENVATVEGFPSGPSHAVGERDEWGVKGALLWAPSDKTEILLRAHYEEDNGINTAPRNTRLSLDKHQISIGPDGVQDTDNEFYGGAIELTTTVGDWDLYSLSAVEGYNQQYGFD